MKILLNFIVIAFLLGGCSQIRKSQNTSASSENMIGEWVHSHEEDENELKVFRLSTYQFPPSRGREKITIKTDGVLEYTPISPNDVPERFLGSWQIVGPDLILEYDDKVITYKIIENNPTILKIR